MTMTNLIVVWAIEGWITKAEYQTYSKARAINDKELQSLLFRELKQLVKIRTRSYRQK